MRKPVEQRHACLRTRSTRAIWTWGDNHTSLDPMTGRAVP